jgi:transketolase
MRAEFDRTMTQLLDEQQGVALVLADIGAGSLLEAAARHPLRVVNVGMREQLMIGVASGLAFAGLRPFVHSYAPFVVDRAYEQIKLDLVHQGVGAVLVSIAGSFDAAAEGRTHQSPGDVALLSTLPGFELHVPGHPGDVPWLLRQAAASQAPVYIRLSERANRRPSHREGGVHAVRTGSPGAPSALAVGPMLDPVLEAVADTDYTVLHAVTVRPFDGPGLRRAVTGDRLALVEPYLEGTSMVEAARALDGVVIDPIGVTSAEVRRYGTRADHEAHHGLDVPGLRRRLLEPAG